MSRLWKPLFQALFRPRLSRGATRRRGGGSPDRWLDWLLDFTVLSALLVGGAALVFTLFFD